MTEQFSRYDTAEYLQNSEDMVSYLEACLEDGDPALITHALGVIAKARGIAQLAKDSGLSTESLYKTFAPESSPEFSTILKVTKALGIKLHAELA